ncbi:zinc finger protein 431-like [Eurosta solidaginis]|uniref:zinc finger protein 431-like n=1 Tax=Eurosta solidaginis TaxID=178769 RepID=UPI0035307EDE
MENMHSTTPVSSEPDTNGGAATDTTFRFYSFLPCTQPKKSSWNPSPKTSGYCTDTSGVLVINDSDDEGSSTISAASEPQFEFLCEIDVDKNVALPRPIELKVELKKEPSDDPIGVQQIDKELAQKQQESIHTAATADYSDCEDELLALCKIEPVCDLSEVIPRNSSEQENNHYIYFTCPQCGERYDSHPLWRRHIVSIHQLGDQTNWNFKRRINNEFECFTCHKTFTRCTLKTLQQHHFTHLPHKVYHCKLCPYEEHSMFLMISHIMLHKERDASIHGNQKKDENAITAREIALWEHESRALMAYICPACGLTFDSEDAWQAHINFSHNFLEKTAENRYGDHFKCSECAVEIFSQHITDLQQHLFTHLPYKSYLKCKICSFNISRRNFMLSHILNLHRNQLSAGSMQKCDSILTKATSTTAAPPTATTGASPAPVTTTTRSPRDERLNTNNMRLSSSIDMMERGGGDEGVGRDDEQVVHSEALLQRISIARNNFISERRTPSPPYMNNNNSLNLSKRKGSFSCEKCNKRYMYSKSFSKHIRVCNFSYNNTTI